MNKYIRKKLIMGLAALMIYSSCTAQKKDQSGNNGTHQNISNTDYSFKNPPYIRPFEKMIYRIDFSSDDSTLIKQDSLHAELYFKLYIKRSLSLEDTVTVRLQGLSYSYSRGGERVKSHDIPYFKKRYEHILSQIEQSYNAYDRFYSIPEGQYNKVKPDTTKIDYRDYIKKFHK